MITLSPEKIKQIATSLDCGQRCFINILSHELVFIPDTDESELVVLTVPNAWEAEFEELKKSKKNYFEIERMNSHETFRVMEEFIDTLENTTRLKILLLEALNNRNPFQNFKARIDNSGDYRQYWFDYKAKKLEDWVMKQLDHAPGK